MKLLFFLFLLQPLLIRAQVSGVQIGPIVSMYKSGGLAYGGELVAMAGLSPTVSLGAGANVVKFRNESHVYLPFYGALKLQLPVRKFPLSVDINIGQSIYKKPQTTGGFYWSSGLTLTTSKRAAPYLSIHYTKYEYEETTQLPYTTITQTRGIQTLTLSVGVWLKNSRRQKKG